MPELQWWQWALGIFSAFCIGMAKTGAPGMGTMIVPLMVMTAGDARHAAAWTVPILSTADLFAVTYWRRHSEARTLFTLIPWVAAGMAGGAAALALDEKILRPIIGAIVVLMVGIYLWRKGASSTASGNSAFFGVFTGFASTVANAAGPVMNLYLLTKRLPKEQFVATGAWFFLVVNLAKIPIYAFYGLFSRESLVFDLLMIPAVLSGATAGVTIIRNIPQKLFEMLFIVLTAISAIFLFRS